MKTETLTLYALAGQLTDVAMTHLAVEKFGHKEGNPLMRSLVERKKYGLLTGLKVGMVAAGVIFHQASSTEEERRRAKNILLFAGTAGFLAGIWNLYQVSKDSRISSDQGR